jgi:hypothetical protein
VTDLSDPKDVRERTRTAKRSQERRYEMVRAVMGLRQGRDWVWEVLGWCHPFQNPFSTNALAMAFQTGEMNIGQRLMADLQAACPELYLQMAGEAKETENVRDELDARAGVEPGGTGGLPGSAGYDGLARAISDAAIDIVDGDESAEQSPR